MVQPIYSKEQLEKFSISELRGQCDRLSIPRRRSKAECIADILATQPQLIAQAELEQHIEDQAEEIAPEQQRLEMNQKGYRDAVEGLISQSSDPCYQVGYERGIRDITPNKKEDLGSQAIAFDKIGSTIYGGVWEAIVNDVKIRIVSIAGGYKTNLTGDAMLVDFGIAIKESLLAVARLQAQPEKPALEVFATNRPNVYGVYSHKAGLESKRYEVDLTSNSCTCLHYQHRHGQEGFKDKHIEAVREEEQIHTKVPMEPIGYAIDVQKGDKPYRFEWLRSLEEVYANLALDFTPTEVGRAVITPLCPEGVERLNAEHERAWDNYSCHKSKF
jgi:hypothetical protein